MLRESEEHRRRERDSADRNFNVWTEYERRKRELPALDAYEYEQACQDIAAALGI
ncbi:MAG: hypothetical protein ACOZEN_08795 [Thermodesulfobacteriota bacterium]